MSLTSDDIMPLVNCDWQRSFAWEHHVKKAVAMHGWNPLYCCLLLHPKIKKTRDENIDKQPSIQICENTSVVENIVTEDGIINASMNLTKGKANTNMDCIIQEKMKQSGRQQQSELMAEGEQITNELSESKRLTSSVLQGT